MVNLRQMIADAAARALAAGALKPLDTRECRVRDGEVEFLIRVAAGLGEKPRGEAEAKKTGETRSGPRSGAAEGANPFLPYDPRLWVADFSPEHVCLLNKFNVVREHVLLVTRNFQPQESPLNARDFAAVWRCLQELDGLAFYNSGPVAGASQPHKHLQVVALPLSESGPAFPLEPRLAEAGSTPHWPAFPLLHRLVRVQDLFDGHLEIGPAQAGEILAEEYGRWAEQLELFPPAGPPRAYNWLMTRQWMWLVPRSREHFQEISLNALAFAGSFFVKSEFQLEVLRQCGPWTALRHVSWPPSSAAAAP